MRTFKGPFHWFIGLALLRFWGDKIDTDAGKEEQEINLYR